MKTKTHNCHALDLLDGKDSHITRRFTHNNIIMAAGRQTRDSGTGVLPVMLFFNPINAEYFLITPKTSMDPFWNNMV